MNRAETPSGETCPLKVLTLRRQDTRKGGLSYSNTLFHLGWYTGLRNVAYCAESDPFEERTDQLPKPSNPLCRQNSALQVRPWVGWAGGCGGGGGLAPLVVGPHGERRM